MAATAARARASVATRPATARPKPARTTRPAKRAPARRRAAARRRQPAGLIPAAVNRVGDIADSGLMVRMIRSRAWIGVLAALLAGIVTLNVISLSYTASSGRVAARSAQLERANAVLRAKLTKDLSGPHVESTAAANGLLAPEPGDIEYLDAGDQYAQAAAKRIEDGLLTASSGVAPAPPPTETAVPTLTPAAPTEPVLAP